MDEERAKEIIDSLVMINVKYHGIPVYIQEVINSETAAIFPLDEMHHEQEVDLNGLYEDDPT
ncbi:H-type small acid-soluble spore protein [Alkalibacillus haloalkaliphilus]|uniref:H-type small acid-soluble spore protein n=1 Tax=Alkalibacillus haloalkaliphilus TaxID=94136 RepID=UPI000316BA55|nr:H-type small acid-soluble spore protein [Alkalibacillus haloalkaliphilus]